MQLTWVYMYIGLKTSFNRGVDFLYQFWGITVKELLNLSSMKNAKVLAGELGLERNITRLNVMEVPDIINWVEEGEFLLTTAYSMKDNIQGLEQLIIDLNNKEVAGLGIKIKRYINEIPNQVLERAELLGFPLIEIPFDISYSTILTESLTEIVNAHTNILSRISNIQNNLIKLMLDGGSLKEIAAAIHHSLDGNTVAIEEYIMGTQIIMSSKNKKIYKSLIDEEQDYLKRREIKKEHYKTGHTRSIDIIQDKEISRISIPIYSENIDYGCIFIWEDKRVLSPVETKVLESSTPIIALDIHKKMTILEIEAESKTEFLKDLFSGKEERIKRAFEKLSYLNFDINNSYSVIVIHIKENEIYKKYKTNVPNYISQLKIRLISIIDKISKDENYNIISTPRFDGVVMLFGSRQDTKDSRIKRDIKKFCMKILSYAEHEGFNEYLNMGIGRNSDSPKEIWVSNREALKVNEYQNKQKGDKILFYEDLGIYKILSFEGLRPELNKFYKDILQGLVNYDKEKGTDLIITLKKYFEFEGNLKKISESMFVHYNTVVYRLQRIKDITNKDLNSYEDRLNFQIALQILDMTQEQNKLNS